MNARSQADHAMFKHLTVEDGLPQGTVLDLHQDKNGLVWIATMSGLAIYDGYKFRTFAHNPTDSTTVSDNYIRTITEVVWPNGDHQIWAGTATSGISALGYDDGRFQEISLDAQNYSPTGINRITAFHQSEDQNVWIGTSQKGLIRISLVTGKQEQVLKGSPERGSISTIHQDLKGRLWVGTSRGGAYIFQDLSLPIEMLQYKPVENIPDMRISAIVQEDEDHVWIGTYNGLYLFNQEGLGVVEAYYHNPKVRSTIAQSEIAKLMKDKDGFLWIGTTKHGLNRLNPLTGEVRHYRFNPGVPSSLTENRILSLMQDRDGVLWIGTNKGISLLSETDPFFQIMVHEPGNENSLSLNRVKAVHQDTVHQGVWVGTFGGGLNYADSKTRNITRFLPIEDDSSSLSSDAVFSIYQRPNSPDDIWIGTFGGGLNRLDFNNNTFSQFKHRPNDSTSVLSDQVYDLVEDDYGNFWIATGNGICKLKDDETFEWYFRPDVPSLGGVERLPTVPIYTLEPDGEHLWLGSIYNGVYRYNIVTNELKQFVHEDEDPFSLSSNRIERQCRRNLGWK